MLHIARIGLVTLLVTSASPAFAFGLNAFGQGRYLSMTPKKQAGETEDPKASTGIAAGLAVQFKFIDLKLINLFAGAGIDLWTLSETESKQKFVRTSIPAELGVSFNALPMLTFQLSGLYDYGLAGKGTVEPGDGIKLTYSTKDDAVYGATARALLTVGPMVRAGLIAQYLTGSYKIKTDEVELPEGVTIESDDSDDAIKQSGYAVGAVVGISF